MAENANAGPRNAVHVLRLVLIIVAGLTIVRAFQSLYQASSNEAVRAVPRAAAPDKASSSDERSAIGKVVDFIRERFGSGDRLLLFVAILFLTTQFAGWTGLLDRLCGQRSFTAMLVHLHVLILQAAMLYWLAMLLGGDRLAFAAVVVVAMFGTRGSWLLLSRWLAAPQTPEELRDMVPAGLADLASAALLVAFLLLRSRIPSLASLLTPEGGAAMVSIINPIIVRDIGSKMHGPTRPPSRARTILRVAVIAAIVLILLALTQV